MNQRKALYGVDPLFLQRVSVRAYDKNAVITKEQIFTLFEAAQWAPSSFNNQSWRFVYALRGTESWNVLFGLLNQFNQAWAVHAGALVVFVSKKTFDFNNSPSRTHSFDTGAAWMNFSLQAAMIGLSVRGIEGFDYDKAALELTIGDGFAVEAMCAVGKPGDSADLPEQLRAKEVPSMRKQLDQLVFEGKFKN